LDGLGFFYCSLNANTLDDGTIVDVERHRRRQNKDVAVE